MPACDVCEVVIASSKPSFYRSTKDINVIYTLPAQSRPHAFRVLVSVMLAAGISSCSGGGHVVPAATGEGGTLLPSSVDSATRSTLSIGPAATTVTEQPTSADAFVDSMGIQTHFLYFSTPYVTQYPAVKSLLGGLGVRHIRDGLDDHNWNDYYPHLKQVATMGIKINVGTVITDTASSIKMGLANLPGIVEAVEGPNEYDLHGGSTWASQLQAFQKMMYPAVKSAPGGSSYDVYGPSITSYRDSLALGSLQNHLDYGTMHNYFANKNPGTVGGTPFPVGKYNSLQFWIGTGHLISGSKPLVTTETGYEDLSSIPNYVTASVKARYVMRELLLQWNAKIARTFFYELVDEGGQSLGFVDGHLNKKPVYIAMSNLLHKLSDPGPTFALKPLSYSLSGDSTVTHTLLQKRDGSYRLMVWLEVPQADPAVPAQTLTFKSATRFGTAAQYVWQDNGSVKTIAHVQKSDGTFTFTVTDRVSEIKLQP